MLVYLSTIVQTSMSDFCFNIVKNFATRFDSKDLPKPITVTKLHTNQLVPRQIPISRKPRNPSFNETQLNKRLKKYDKTEQLNMAAKIKRGIARNQDLRRMSAQKKYATGAQKRVNTNLPQKKKLDVSGILTKAAGTQQFPEQQFPYGAMQNHTVGSTNYNTGDYAGFQNPAI